MYIYIYIYIHMYYYYILLYYKYNNSNVGDAGPPETASGEDHVGSKMLLLIGHAKEALIYMYIYIYI